MSVELRIVLAALAVLILLELCGVDTKRLIPVAPDNIEVQHHEPTTSDPVGDLRADTGDDAR